MGKLAEQLSELSKRDDVMIVGSEIRAALQELEKENAELRAQLARCVEFIGNEFDNHKTSFTQIRMKRLNFIESLPDTAKYDAEILRCAEYAVSDDCVDFTGAYEYLARAVQVEL